MKRKEKPILKEKAYTHFDKRISADKMKKYVKSPEKVAKHAFMPLIHFKQDRTKFSKESGRKPKVRDLYYVAHKDAFVYQWYSSLLNKEYNRRVKVDGTNNCAIAYRTNKPGKFNAHYAKEAIDFIRSQGNCYIIVGDFTGFFDHLDHEYLKSMLCDLLNVSKLPNDYWNILKNVTKYSWFDSDDILEMGGYIDYGEKDKHISVWPIKQFRENKSKLLKKNFHGYGIPQGTPISAILSNIYMIKFDKAINNLITSKNGLYRRYSDDFVIIVPSHIDIHILWERINEIINSTKRLILQPDKTKVFFYSNKKITNCNKELFTYCKNSKNEFEYLGFAFDGEYVKIREKTISKFYYRAYRKIDTARLRICGFVDKKPDKFSIYETYTHLGKQKAGNGRGNFLDYIDRCVKVFGKDEKLDIVSKRHWAKFQNRLKMPIKRS